jgi:hypothetical protein
MSVTSTSSPRRGIALVLTAVALVSACDRTITAPPAAAKRVQIRPASIEGDTLDCRFGWTVAQGRYVCSEEE